MWALLVGIARIRWAMPNAGRIVGCDVMEEGSDAARRALRVATELFRFSSSSSRKARTRSRSRSSSANAAGFFRKRAGGKENQHAQGVAIAGHGRGRGVALLGQSSTEIGLAVAGPDKGAHSCDASVEEGALSRNGEEI